MRRQRWCRHLARVADYLWVAEDGLKMQGYNGSQLWDTAFTAQAYAATGLLADATSATLSRAHTYIKNTQACSALLSPPALLGARVARRPRPELDQAGCRNTARRLCYVHMHACVLSQGCA